MCIHKNSLHTALRWSMHFLRWFRFKLVSRERERGDKYSLFASVSLSCRFVYCWNESNILSWIVVCVCIETFSWNRAPIDNVTKVDEEMHKVTIAWKIEEKKPFFFLALYKQTCTKIRCWTVRLSLATKQCILCTKYWKRGSNNGTEKCNSYFISEPNIMRFSFTLCHFKVSEWGI